MNNEPTKEDLAAMAKARPTRRMVDRACKDCGYMWIAPSPNGRCPRCKGENVANGEHERVCALPTV